MHTYQYMDESNPKECKPRSNKLKIWIYFYVEFLWSQHYSEAKPCRAQLYQKTGTKVWKENQGSPRGQWGALVAPVIGERTPTQRWKSGCKLWLLGQQPSPVLYLEILQPMLSPTVLWMEVLLGATFLSFYKSWIVRLYVWESTSTR